MRAFDEKVADESLKPVLSVIQGLMKFVPSDRTSASQAVEDVRVLRQSLADQREYLN